MSTFPEAEIPFGFQYYRAPTPFESEWADDLRTISEMGFNTVKYWVQWRSSHTGPSEFEFGDIDRLMDLAAENGLKVVLNVIFDVAPTWLYAMHPEAKMITADGQVLEPAALCHRQIGGAPGPCYHHGESRALKNLFLDEVVKRFQHHPALYLWDLWNEPELTTSMKRELSFENQVCYCRQSLNQFQLWLSKKYGSIGKLNDKWQRNYRDWSEVEPPRTQGVYNDLVDWRQFFVDTLTEEMKLRADVVKKRDTWHPVMCHTVPMPIFNPITCASDDFALADQCDWFGNSLGSSAWSADLLKSAAKGKKLINSEIHALPGTTALKPRKLDMKELKRQILVPLSRGITGFLFWQYRPELLGLEAPAWGSTYADGSVTPWLKHMAELNDMIQSKKDLLVNGTRASDGMGIIYSNANQIAQFAAYGHLQFYNDSIQGIHRLLHDLNYKVEFIHEKDALPDLLAAYRCIWLPYPLYMTQELSERLRQWVKDGGTLISEYAFGTITAEQGLHSTSIPGYGFDDVFGVKELWCHSAEFLDHSYHSSTLTHQHPTIQVQPVAASGKPLYGAGYQSEIACQAEVEVLAVFDQDGGPAITCNRYGQGRAIWLGSLLGAGYNHVPHDDARVFWRQQLQAWELEPVVQVTEFDVRVDWLDSQVSDDGRMESVLFVQNMKEEQRDVEVELNRSFSRISCWFAGDEATLDGPRLRLRLQPGECHVYQLD